MKYFIVLMVLFSNMAHAMQEMNVKKAELSRVSTQIQLLQKNISLDQHQQQQLEQELQMTETAIGDLGKQVSTLNSSITQEQQRLAKLKISQRNFVNKLHQQNAVLGQQIRAAYRLGEAQPIKVIFNQDNPSTIQRHLTYYAYITKARLQLIENTKQTLANLKTTVQSITAHQKNLKSLLNQKQLQQNEQQDAQGRRQNLMAVLHQNVQTKQQQLNTLMANQTALQGIISHLKTQIDTNVTGKGQYFSQMQGKVHWPIKGRQIAGYGSPLDVGDQRLSGVILQATLGAPVRSIYAGKVIFANWLRGFGLLVIINHGNNFMSLYGRNHALYAKVGDHVNTGDVIATAGNSGGFDQVSLYFEIRQNGIPTNPNFWCR